MGGKITFLPPNCWAEEGDGNYSDYQKRKAELVNGGWEIVDEHDTPPGPLNPNLLGFGDTKLRRNKK